MKGLFYKCLYNWFLVIHSGWFIVNHKLGMVYAVVDLPSINEVNHLQTIRSGDFFTSQREVFIFHSGHISYYIPLDPITAPFLLVKSPLLIIKSLLLIVQSYFCCKIPEFSISLVLNIKWWGYPISTYTHICHKVYVLEL